MDFDQMEVFDISFEELSTTTNRKEILGILKDIDTFMSKMGYTPIYGTWPNEHIAEVMLRPSTNPFDNAGAAYLADRLWTSLEDGNDVVCISFDDLTFFEGRITSVEGINKGSLKITSTIFEEGEIIETYSHDDDKDIITEESIKQSFPNEYNLVDGGSYGLALNALGIKKYEEYKVGGGYTDSLRFSFEGKPQMWFHNEMFIPMPFNCSLPVAFVKVLRQANAKV
jgi:hypothetical protein